MCRLAAFPPGFPKSEALDILAAFEDRNTDGVGSVYVKDKRFVVNKWPKSFSRITRHRRPLLDHMPYDGWTLAHLRKASHGGNYVVNTHPFEVGPWAVIHNGIWTEYNIVKLALQNKVEIYGDTDSEVAAHLINIAGPKKFAAEVTWGGVFMALNLDGSLHVMRTSGELDEFPWRNKILMASTLARQRYGFTTTCPFGWFRYDPEGKLSGKRIKRHDLKTLEAMGELPNAIPTDLCCGRNEFAELSHYYPKTRSQLEQSMMPHPDSEEAERFDNMTEAQLQVEIERMKRCAQTPYHAPGHGIE